MLSDIIFDSRKKLIPAYNFVLSLGPLMMSFSKVSNIVTSIEYETIQEGGNNDYPHVFKKPKQQPDTLIMEKGVRKGIADTPLNLLIEGMTIEVGTIIVMNGLTDIQKVFYFKRGIITKREFSELNAMSNEIMIEKLEIAHSGLVEIPIPV